MKKLYIFIAITLILFGVGLGVYFYKSKNNNSNSNSPKLNDFPYNSTRVLANDFSDNESSVPSQEENSEDDSSSSNPTDESTKLQITETQVADFTTKIYTKESDRQNNISITCSTLNDTTIENGEIFSFCSTVGKATTDKGYKKADVFIDGKKVEALGRR